MIRVLFLILLVLCPQRAAEGREIPHFETVVIDDDVGRVCYAVTVADVDGDGQQDIVAATESRVLWYQAPSWTKRVIIDGQTEEDNVCIAPLDIDGDGAVDFALGAGWTKSGTIQWLSRNESLNDRWDVHFIGQELWTHRMRFADVLGIGKPQLVVSPLNATEGAGVRLTAFRIPKNPGTDAWERTVLDDTLNRMHNHWHTSVAQGAGSTLTASAEGIHLIRKTEGGFVRGKLHPGMPGETAAESGAGEIKVGRFGNGIPFMVTIEPMHGTSVAVYPMNSSRGPGQPLRRIVIEDELRRGHALWTADFDRDGADEIVVGHSDESPGEIKGPGVYVYVADDNSGTSWTKHVIDDGGIATEDLIVADVTGDGRSDIVAGGRASHNVVLYVNTADDQPRR